jgi:hypothetical protein
MSKTERMKRVVAGKTRFYFEHCMEYVMLEMTRLLEDKLGDSTDVVACEAYEACWSIASRV